MDRKDYIGSSDARDIVHGNWGPVWEKKVGLTPEPDLSDDFRVQLGVITEPFHVDWTIRRLRAENPDWERVKAPDMQFWLRDMDGVPVGTHPDSALFSISRGDIAPVEVKFGSRGYDNPDSVIDFYMPQFQHHMLAMGAERCLVSISMDRDEPVRRWIGASPDWHQHMLGLYKQFWAHVIEKRRPSPAFAGEATAFVPSLDSVPINGMIAKDMTGHNEFASMAEDYIQYQPAAQAFDRAKEGLKKLVPKNVREAYLPGVLRLKRDAKGALRFTVEAQAAE